MKILMLNHEFPPVGGGASPVTFELCTQLAAQGHHVDVVTMHYKDTPRFERVNGFNIYRTPAIRKKPNICYPHELATYVPGAFFKTLQLARKNEYDIIHCHFVVPGGILAWLISKLTKIPYIITCHGSDVPGYNPDRFKLIHKLILPLWEFLASRPKLLTTPSQSLKNLLESNMNTLNVEVVPNGILLENFKVETKEKKILMCSRILPRKGFQYALEAVKDIDVDWQIDVVGDGPYLSELKKLAEKVKMPVKFWGWIDRKSEVFYSLYDKASIFVFPSSAESFGMVIAEAMAAGCAIIASDIPAHREVLGDAGLYVPIENSDEIKTKLTELINDKEQMLNLQAKATKEVGEKFAWKTIAEQFEQIYKK